MSPTIALYYHHETLANTSCHFLRHFAAGAISEQGDADHDAEAHQLQVGDELVAINGDDVGLLSRLDCTRKFKSIAAESEFATLTVRR